jgi:hypothetical protein
MQGPEILLKGATTCTAKATDTAHGFLDEASYPSEPSRMVSCAVF